MTALPHLGSRAMPGSAPCGRLGRGAARRGRHQIAVLLAPPTLLLLAAALAAPAHSDAAGPDCADCAFRGAPVRLSEISIALPGKPHPYFTLRSAVAFTDRNGLRWEAPRGTLTDGASIPRALVPLIGQPRSPEFREAAALHDAWCGTGNEALPQFRTRSWEEVHRMFHDALLAAGVVPAKARVMFAAVYLAGPRWDDPARVLDAVPESQLREEMRLCLEFIAREDPSRAEIEAWMRERELALRAAAGTKADKISR